MAVVATDEDGHRRVYVKGAMEAVLPLCTRILTEAGETDLTEELRTRVTRLNAEEAGRGFRMLAFAQRSDPHEPVEEDLVLLGCVGMTDAPRKGVPGAVEECHRAGIRVVMVTGDHEETAGACRVHRNEHGSHQFD